MAETEKKISELTTASQINDTDLTILSQGSSGSGFASVKATILAIANKIVSGINFTSALQTTDKTITGAINEVAQGGGGGSSTLEGLSDVDIDTLTLDDGQGLVYDETEGKWVNGSASGGGHTIVDNSGTSLAQEPKLKLNGMYVHDDSANQTTVGEYYREMTTAQYNQLSATEKQGMIRLTDNNYIGEADDILYESGGQGNDVTVGDKLDSIVEGHTIKNDSGTSLTQRDTLQATGVYAHDDSTNSKTVIDIVREFNSVSDIENLTGEEAKGFQYLDDDVYDEFTAGDIGFDNSDTSFVGTNVQDVLEEVDGRLNSYSTTEKVVGTWIDGKPLYACTFNFGAMPNNTMKRITHGIANLKRVVNIDGYASNGNASFPMPHIYPSGGTVKGIQITADATYISVTTMEDLTSFNESYITIRYTKTTD